MTNPPPPPKKPKPDAQIILDALQFMESLSVSLRDRGRLSILTADLRALLSRMMTDGGGGKGRGEGETR